MGTESVPIQVYNDEVDYYRVFMILIKLPSKMQEVAFQSLRKSQKIYKHKLHSSITVDYWKTLLISKQIVNLDMYLFFF